MIWGFNYNQAVRQAGQIEYLADGLRNLANNKYADAVAGINSSWDGETSQMFLRHCEETKQLILSRANELDRLAGRIREVARILKEAEERARREIELLNSSSGGGGSR